LPINKPEKEESSRTDSVPSGESAGPGNR
jgi:hypothetical protein